MSNKLVMAVFIIGFWLLYPIPFMFMENANFDNVMLDGSNVKSTIEDANIITAPKDMLSIYFDIFFTGIPDASFIINRFINLMQLVSGLILFLLIRGD